MGGGCKRDDGYARNAENCYVRRRGFVETHAMPCGLIYQMQALRTVTYGGRNQTIVERRQLAIVGASQC